MTKALTTLDALWISTSPSLQRFDQPLQTYLNQQTAIAQWQYLQTQDEPSSLDEAVRLLRLYLNSCNGPIHLVGHGTGGLVALLYARQHPERVKSLTLLAVGAQLSLDWMAHYYFHLQLLPCGRQAVLAHVVRDLFGHQSLGITKSLVKRLQQDIDHSPSPNSLLNTIDIPQQTMSMPLLVCGSQNDVVIDTHELQGWCPWLKGSDRIWQCPRGHHFFHYFHPQMVGDQILDFWQSTPDPLAPPMSLNSLKA